MRDHEKNPDLARAAFRCRELARERGFPALRVRLAESMLDVAGYEDWGTFLFLAHRGELDEASDALEAIPSEHAA